MSFCLVEKMASFYNPPLDPGTAITFIDNTNMNSERLTPSGIKQSDLNRINMRFKNARFSVNDMEGFSSYRIPKDQRLINIPNDSDMFWYVNSEEGLNHGCDVKVNRVRFQGRVGFHEKYGVQVCRMEFLSALGFNKEEINDILGLEDNRLIEHTNNLDDGKLEGHPVPVITDVVVKGEWYPDEPKSIRRGYIQSEYGNMITLVNPINKGTPNPLY